MVEKKMEEIKMARLEKKIKIEYTIKVLTGLHIGGSSDNVEIGGIDNPVIKLLDGKPYIPGSSLKGKIRSLLEQKEGCDLGKSTKINKLFGSATGNKNNEANPSKVIFRDFYLTKDSIEKLNNSDYLSMPYTESKYENSINRVTGKAISPRQTERVPAGVEFKGEIILNIWDNDTEQEFTKMLEDGISLLENDYLGGSGSRGYGQVKFEELNKVELSDKNNWKDENKE